MQNAVVLVVGALLVALRQVELLHWSKRNSASWQERQKEQRRVQRARHCLLGKAIGPWRELQVLLAPHLRLQLCKFVQSLCLPCDMDPFHTAFNMVHLSDAAWSGYLQS